MTKSTKKIIIFSVIFLSTIALLRYSNILAFDNGESIAVEQQQADSQEDVKIPEKKDRIVKIEIGEGDTYGALMQKNGVDYALAMEIYDSAQEIYDLIKIRQGKIIELVYDKDDDSLKNLKYKIDSEDELVVSKINQDTQNQHASSTEEIEEQKNWKAEIIPIDYEIKIKTSGGTIKSSMYQAALDNNIDIRAIIKLANAFQWSIDFAMDPRVGDEFKLVYEERFLDGKYQNPGKILGAYYINAGEKYELYYFEESEENKGYFDQDGNSAQKMFLKAPVAFKYISSGYTTGPRVVMEFGLVGPHRAIDYAAAMGTPIRTVGDGTVVFAGWKTGYGNFTSIRHNGTYTTHYAHQSKFAVHVGQKVKQGDVIGYVGSTGYSTGPHLHFEMVKNGVKINPLKEILPPGKPIKKENMERFLEVVKKIRKNFE